MGFTGQPHTFGFYPLGPWSSPEIQHTIPAEAGIQWITNHFLLDSCFRRNGKRRFHGEFMSFAIEYKSMRLP